MAPDEAGEQLEWTRKTLGEARFFRGAVVFMHHPFFDEDVGEPDGYHSITKKDRKLWLDLFADNNVRAVYSGHRHTTIPEHEWRGVRLVNTNAVCNSFDNKPSLRVVNMYKDDVTDTLYPRDSLPKTSTSPDSKRASLYVRSAVFVSSQNRRRSSRRTSASQSSTTSQSRCGQ